VRNLFTAVVSGLRGFESFAETHLTDKTKKNVLTYEWRLYQNSTASDLLTVYEDTRSEPDLFGDCPCGDVVRLCLRVAFMWAPTFNEQLSIRNYVTKLKTDLVIVAPGNTYEETNPLSHEWAAKYGQLLLEDTSLQLGVLHFTWGIEAEVLKERKAALHTWTTNSSYAGRMSIVQQQYTPISKKITRQIKNTWHFACGLEKATVQSDTIMAFEPCTDQTDVAFIRALITVHFDALSA
jgi:hypothetical protein